MSQAQPPPARNAGKQIAFLIRALLLTVLILLAFLWFVQPRLARLFGLDGPVFPSGKEPSVLGRADPDWRLETLDGEELRFGSFRGKTVFVNEWATWCPPCVEEIPSIEQLYETLKGEGIEFVLVTQQPREQVRAFVAKKGWKVPIYIASKGIPPAFECNAIPTTFIVNGTGEVVFEYTGGMDWNTGECAEFLRRVRGN